jgi:hypothetical protein
MKQINNPLEPTIVVNDGLRITAVSKLNFLKVFGMN